MRKLRMSVRCLKVSALYIASQTLALLVLSSLVGSPDASAQEQRRRGSDISEASEASEASTPLLEVRRQAIRNGSLNSTQLALSLEQERAIGWFFLGSTSDDAWRRLCTGTVISWNAVLTARHCFRGERAPQPGTPLGFAIPSDDLVKQEELIADAVFTFRDDAILISEAHDLAIVRFSGEPFRRPGLKPIPINAQPLEDTLALNLVGSQIEVVGYGETHHSGENGRYFASVKLELITPHFMMVNGEQEQGICSGDSGGPALAAGIDGEVNVFAVVTKGDDCCVGIDQLTRVDIEARDIVNYANATTPPEGVYPRACWGVSRKNRCDRDVLSYCQDGESLRQDCREYNLVCGYNAAEAQFKCMENRGCAVREGCLTSQQVVRCELGQERVINCVQSVCQTIDDGERAGCVSFEAPSCDEDNLVRLADASQARFRAEPSCSGAASSSPISDLNLMLLLISWVLMSALRTRRFKSSVEA